MCAPPRPLMPATPTRMTSLAPSTWPDDFVPAMVNRLNAVLAAAVVFRNLRRERRDMRKAPSNAAGGKPEWSAYYNIARREFPTETCIRQLAPLSLVLLSQRREPGKRAQINPQPHCGRRQEQPEHQPDPHIK